MALNNNELFESANRAAFPRIAPDIDGGVFTRTFEDTGASPTYDVATPVYLDAADSNRVKVWTNGQAVEGFVYPRKVTLAAGFQVMGEIMQRGKIHVDDIVLPAGEVLANLKTALRNALVSKGLLIQGLDAAK